MITGNVIDGKLKKLKHITDLLFNLDARYGVYGVSGNHEMYHGYKEWLAYFKKGGIHFLENDSTIIKDYADKSILNLCGISDPLAKNYGVGEHEVEVKVTGTDLRLDYSSKTKKVKVRISEK